MRGMEAEVIWEQFSMDELEHKLEEMFAFSQLNMQEIFNHILDGDIIGALKEVFFWGMDAFQTEIGSFREMVVMILLVGICFAILSHFIDAFDQHQVVDMSFYYAYLILLGILFRGFLHIIQITQGILTNTVSFIRVFLPSYLLIIGMSSGPSSAVVSYEMFLALIFVMEQVFVIVLLPMIYSYTILSVMNGIWIEEKLGLLTDLLKKIIQVSIKTVLGVVTGVSFLQSKIAPALDQVRGGAIQKILSVIPGIGNIADGVFDITMGTAVLLKNCIGVFFTILFLGMCMLPVIQIGVMVFLWKGCAALLGMVADKRIVQCIDKMGDGGLLLLKLTFGTILLLLIAIAMAI